MKLWWCVFFVISIVVASISLPNNGWTQEDQEPAREYVSSKQCKLCHNKPDEGAQYAAWESAQHSRAFETLLSDEALVIAKEKALAEPPSESASCLRCHVTGYDPVTKAPPEKLRMEDGVQCDSCHGPGSAHMADGKVLRMNKDADIDVMANLVMPGEKTCVACHNADNPTWDPERYVNDSGETSGFDFDQAFKIISHTNPKKSAK